MESFENEQYITFPIDELQVVQENVSHEEICKPVSECTTEILSEMSESVDACEDQATIQIVESDETDSSTIYVKQESEILTSGDDESMAVEALRQLGGMYPNFEKQQPPTKCTDCGEIHEDSEKHTCSICGEEFESKDEYHNHKICHQVNRPHACKTCGNLFATKSSLHEHVNEAHQVKKIHKCSVCGVEFQRPSSLSNHMKIHSYVAGRAIGLLNEQKESQASTSVATAIQELDSVQWSMPVYSFGEQNVEGADGQKLENLQEFTVIPKGDVGQFEYQNATTNQHYVTISGFENNDESMKIENHGEIAIKKIVVGFEEEKRVISPIECEYCDKQFQDAVHLATHQKTCIKRLAQTEGSDGTNWGKHVCSECGKKFTTKQKMFRHQWIHRKKTHCCEVCGTQFERQPELDEHRLAAHPGGTPFICNECGKSFVSRQGLWEHGRTHAGSPAHFHCDKCSKTFTSRQGYLIHHRTHTGERPYGCKFCWKAFRDGGTLRKHERIHTGERPHVCPLCSRAFNQKVVLREHVRWVHAAAKYDTEGSEPPFLCPLCGEVNQDRDELCAHIVKHSDKMIAEAKAKTNNETKKTSKSKKKPKESAKPNEDTKAAKSVEIAAPEQEIYLTVTEPLNKTISGQNIFLDSKNNTYILVNTRKSQKVFVSELKQTNQLSNGNGNAIQICIEDPEAEVEQERGEEKTAQKRNTLRLLSKKNASVPVVTIPNPQTSDHFSSQIELVEDEGGEFVEQEMEIVQVDGVVEGVQFEQDEQDNDGATLEECRVCGEVGFKDKLELMEHVKTHCM